MRLFAFYICGALVLWSLGYAALSLAPRVPTNRKDLWEIDQLSKLVPGKSFIELWSGTSIVCMYIARLHPDCTVVGIELARPLFLYSRLKQKLSWPKNLVIIYGDILKKDISSYDVLYIFGLPRTLHTAFKTKIFQEMKPGAVLLSYLFDLDGWEWWTIEKISLKKWAWVIHRFTKDLEEKE